MSGAEGLALAGRATGALLVVIVVIGLAARLVRRARGESGSSGLRVVERIGLSREANLTVVEVANKMLLLGVTAQGVTMLANLDDKDGRGPSLSAATHVPVIPAAVAGARTGPQWRALAAIREATARNALTRQAAAKASPPAATQPLASAQGAAPTDDRVAPARAVVSAGKKTVNPGTGSTSTSSGERTVAERLVAERDATASRPRNGGKQAAFEPMSLPRLERRPMPAQIAMDEYPDLASALRAAGRTSQPAEDAGAAFAAELAAEMASPSVPNPAHAAGHGAIRRPMAPVELPTVSSVGLPSASPDERTATQSEHRSVDGAHVAAPRTRAEAKARRASSPAGHTPLPAPAEGYLSQTHDGQAYEVPNVQGYDVRGYDVREYDLDAAGDQIRLDEAAGIDRGSDDQVLARPRTGRRTAGSAPVQASGSVLDPNTWKQGMDALRELTVRRG